MNPDQKRQKMSPSSKYLPKIVTSEKPQRIKLMPLGNGSVATLNGIQEEG